MSGALQRLGPAVGASALGAVLVAYATLGLEGEGLDLALAAGGVAVGLLLVEAAGWWRGAAVVAQGLLALGYLSVLVAQGRELDTAAPAFAAGLLLAGELAVLARDGGLTVGAGVIGRRLIALAAAALAVVGAGWVMLTAAALPLPGGAAATLFGVLAAVGIPALLLALRAGAR